MTFFTRSLRNFTSTFDISSSSPPPAHPYSSQGRVGLFFYSFHSSFDNTICTTIKVRCPLPPIVMQTPGANITTQHHQASSAVHHHNMALHQAWHLHPAWALLPPSPHQHPASRHLQVPQGWSAWPPPQCDPASHLTSSRPRIFRISTLTHPSSGWGHQGPRSRIWVWQRMRTRRRSIGIAGRGWEWVRTEEAMIGSRAEST